MQTTTRANIMKTIFRLFTRASNCVCCDDYGRTLVQRFYWHDLHVNACVCARWWYSLSLWSLLVFGLWCCWYWCFCTSATAAAAILPFRRNHISSATRASFYSSAKRWKLLNGTPLQICHSGDLWRMAVARRTQHQAICTLCLGSCTLIHWVAAMKI